MVVLTASALPGTAARGLSQAELARAAGTSQARISSYESGSVVPNETTQQRLLAALRPRPSEVLHRHREAVKRLAAKHHLGNVRVFGSVARGHDRADSDVDLLVEVAEGVGLVTLTQFALEVEDLLRVRVDVVTEGGLDPTSEIISEALAL